MKGAEEAIAWCEAMLAMREVDENPQATMADAKEATRKAIVARAAYIRAKEQA